MKLIKMLYVSWSVLIVFFIPFLIPSNFISEGIGLRGSYEFGFPFTFITIYQHAPGSNWFFDNFFSGNHGMHISIGELFINLLLIYLILQFSAKRFNTSTVSFKEIEK